VQIVSEWWWLGFIPVGVGIFLIYVLWDDFRTWSQASNTREEMSTWKSLTFFFGDSFFYIVFYLIVMFFVVQKLIDEGLIILT